MLFFDLLSFASCDRWFVPCLRIGAHDRWLTTSEALCAQGIPVYPRLSFGTAASPFALDYLDFIPEGDRDETSAVMCCGPSDRRAIPQRSGRTAVAGMAGNAMHCESVGICLLYILSRGELSFKDIAHSIHGRLLARPGAQKSEQLNSTLWALGQWINGGSPPRALRK